MAVLVNQRMVSNGRDGRVVFWAWTVSIVVHLAVLTVLGLVKLPQSKTQAGQGPITAARLSRISKLAQAAPIIRKPKVKDHLTAAGASELTEKADRLLGSHFAARRRASRAKLRSSVGRKSVSLPANQVFANAKSGSQKLADFASTGPTENLFSPAGTGILPAKIEFFGICTDQRKICYLVDCSGSMRGTFGRVRKQLAESIQSLRPDQYFYIIFFGGGRLLELGNGKLIRATKQAKSAACDFIESVQPAGQTNALAGFKRAMQINDGRGISPSIIYLLTDGFELTSKVGAKRDAGRLNRRDSQWFGRQVADLRRRFAPAVIINTIGFWPAGEDRKMLELIAKQSGGEFVIVAE